MNFLFMASMCFLLIPELLKALVFCMMSQSLPVILTMSVDVLGILSGFILLILYIRRRQQHETPGILVCLEGLMPALCAYMLTRLVIEFAYPVMSVLFLRSTLLGITIYAIITVLLFILQGLAFYAFVIRCSGHKGTFGSYIRRIYLGIPASLLVGLAGLCGDLAKVEPPFMNVAVHFLMYLAAALIMTCLLWLAFLLMDRMAAKATWAPSIGLEFRAYNTVFTVGALLLLGFSAFRSLYNDPVDTINETLDVYIYEAEMDMMSVDLDSAVEDMENMASTLAVWKQLAGIEESTALDTAYSEHTLNTQLMHLTALYYGTTEDIEKYLRTYGNEPELSLTLLDLYDSVDVTMDFQTVAAQNHYKRAAIIDCVEHGYYTAQWVRPKDVEGKTLKLAGALQKYTQYEQVLAVLSLWRDIYQTGNVTKELVDGALALAEQYPDNWMIQYAAAQIGCQLTYDDAGHYEATGDAALRYLDLYIMEKDPSESEIYDRKITVSKMLIDCYQYEKALDCVKPVLSKDESGNAFMIAVQCYNELGMLEECYQTSDEYLAQYPDNSYAMYYGALSALKLGMHDEAIAMTSKLAAMLENCEDNDTRIYLDYSLYSLLQFISFNDNNRWTGYQYAFYNDLTEEQWAVIHQNAFFEDYLNAVYNCFKGDLDLALQLVEGILAENEQLPNAWYLKGAILYNMQDEERYDEAVEAYRKSLAIYPEFAAAWYAMANAYDGLGEYELAIEACEHALALLPEQDHGEDWYGISVHCKNLLSALQDQVG